MQTRARRVTLREERRLSHGAAAGDPLAGNVVVHGENLAVLDALRDQLRGAVRLAYLDPPYNTGGAFAHYDDDLAHDRWLAGMRARLQRIWQLLRDDGSLWIHLDDHECHYLKVACDALFGRDHYLGSIVWEKDKGRRGDTALSLAHDYILVYARDPARFVERRHLLPRAPHQLRRYRNPDGDPRGPWLQGDNGTAKSAPAGSRWPITLPSGRVVTPPKGRGWAFSRATFEAAQKEGRVWFGSDGNGMPIVKRYLSKVQAGVVPRSWWPADEVGHNQEAKRDHLHRLLPDAPRFDTPKPERLLHRILSIATDPGDLVLDPFAGSGTTGAAALKLGRRFLLVEEGEQARTHIAPRLRLVVDGADPDGATPLVGWQGGGGFRFLRAVAARP